MPATTRNIASLIMLLGLADILADRDEPAASTDAADAPADSEKPTVKDYRFDDEAKARATFLADHRALIEDESVAIVVVGKRENDEPRSVVLTLPGICPIRQAEALCEAADAIAATHPAGNCKR